jgi:hypothetical protein
VALLAGIGIVAFLGYRVYGLTDCSGSPEVLAGGDRFSCLEPYNWFAINMSAVFLALFGVSFVALLVVHLVQLRRNR